MSTAVASLQQTSQQQKRAPREKKQKVEVNPEDVRRSARPRTEVSYAELEGFPALPRDPRPRVVRTLDEEEVEALRQKNGAQVVDEQAEPSSSQADASKKGRGPQDSGKGVRIQVRRGVREGPRQGRRRVPPPSGSEMLMLMESSWLCCCRAARCTTASSG